MLLARGGRYACDETTLMRAASVSPAQVHDIFIEPATKPLFPSRVGEVRAWSTAY